MRAHVTSVRCNVPVRGVHIRTEVFSAGLKSALQHLFFIYVSRMRLDQDHGQRRSTQLC